MSNTVYNANFNGVLNTYHFDEGTLPPQDLYAVLITNITPYYRDETIIVPPTATAYCGSDGKNWSIDFSVTVTNYVADYLLYEVHWLAFPRKFFSGSLERTRLEEPIY